MNDVSLSGTSKPNVRDTCADYLVPAAEKNEALTTATVTIIKTEKKWKGQEVESGSRNPHIDLPRTV